MDKFIEIEVFLPFLCGIAVTGRRELPVIEGISMAMEHLGFLGNRTAKLTGKMSVRINTYTGDVIELTSGVPAIELVIESGAFWVLPHRIQLASEKQKK